MLATNVHAERTFQTQLNAQEIRDRILRWAGSEGFGCKNETPNRWVFQRGNHLAVGFDLRAIAGIRFLPTEVVIEVTPSTPYQIKSSWNCGSLMSMSFTNTVDRYHALVQEVEKFVGYFHNNSAASHSASQQRHCPSCSSPIIASAKFCTSCGTRLLD
jgi:hypothetical protein